MYIDALSQCQRRPRKCGSRFKRVERNRQTQTHSLTHLPQWHIAKDENGSLNPRLAQGRGLANRGNTYHAGPIMQHSVSYFDRAMPISVSLEAGKDTHPWPNQGLYLSRIISDGTQIYLNPRRTFRTRHHNLLPTRRLPYKLSRS